MNDVINSKNTTSLHLVQTSDISLLQRVNNFNKTNTFTVYTE